MRFDRLSVAILFLLFTLSASGKTGPGQSAGVAGTISGVVTDPSGAVVAGATVEIQNPVSQFDHTATTDAKGSFTFTNVPFNPYHMTIVAKGFAPYVQDVDVRSLVPVNLNLSLKVGSSSTTVTVQAEGNDLIENTSTFHTDVDRSLVNKLPLESQSSSLSSLVTLSTPGIAADSNGLFHGLGDHAENSFSIDGQPVTDQVSKVFSNQLPVSAVQSIEVISGAPPAEYGDKTSVVIDVTTRSGLGVTTPHGSATASYGAFGTSNAAFDLEYGTQRWGNFISVSGLNTGRFLDPPEFSVMHDKGNEENFFDRVDYQISSNDSLHLNGQYTRSWFQTPNSFDAQNATPWSGVVVDNGGLDPNGNLVGPSDQRSKIGTFNIAPSWTHLISPDAVLTFGAYVRHDGYNYYPSDNPFADLGPVSLQRESVGQDRTLTNAGVHASVSYVKGINNIKAGINYMQTFLNEDDSLGVVDPTLNAPCLDANGNPVWVGNQTVNDPANCATAPTSNPLLNPAPFTANPAFLPILGCYDLTRKAPLPPSDGCPTGLATSTNFVFDGRADVKELGMYIQDTITWKNWAFNLGIRGDVYNGLTRAQQAEPRLGAAYNIKQTNTVLRVSYARTLETPFNENLVLSSTGCSSPVLNPLLLCSSSALTPLSPGFRNEFHAGLEQAFGKHVVFSGEYIWKYTHNAYDFSVLGNTPITFPIEWNNSKIPGFAGRLNITDLHGFNAYTVFSSVAARFFTPQIGGAGAVPSAVGPFRIDHDEHFNQTTHLQYQPWKKGPWLGFNWRYDSGLVAGPVPCAGGNCANGPLGTSGFGGNDIIDASIISPDQQYEAGLYCGSVHATPSTPISSSLGPNLCLASNYGSSLVKIPAPDTENDDHNPPRIAPRNLFDIAIGDDNLFHGDRYKWSAQLTVINVANEYALYNFLSTFSGTHYVTPRAITGEIGFHF